MSQYTRAEIAQVLQTAELLNHKDSGEKINISRFCQEAGISRKNAYKHKKNDQQAQNGLTEQIALLEREKAELAAKLQLSEARAHEVDVYRGCNEVLVSAIKHNKKNFTGTKQQRQLIAAYNKIASLQGLELLNCWE